jgi:hypothetical protein
MRILLITMLSVAVMLGACSKKTATPQQVPVIVRTGQQHAPAATQMPPTVVTTPPASKPTARVNNIVAPLSPEAAASTERVLVETVFYCRDKTKFTAFFKPSTLEIDGGWRSNISLQQQTIGSGFWYRNAQYDLRGKGRDAVLTIQGRKPVVCSSNR